MPAGHRPGRGGLPASAAIALGAATLLALLTPAAGAQPASTTTTSRSAASSSNPGASAAAGSTTTASTTATVPTSVAPPGTYGCRTASGATTTTAATITSATATMLTGTSTTTSPSTTTLPTTPSGTSPAYYLVESSGLVSGFANAAIYGSGPARRLRTPIVAAAATPGDTGYWLLGAAGNLYNYGAAVDYGTPVHQAHLGTFTAMAATPDGGGFVVVTSSGNLFHYGDAPFCGSPVHQKLAGSVDGVLFTPDGDGYWVFTTGGQVFAYGDAGRHGAGKGPLGSKLVGMAATPDGGGYWLAYSDGAVRQFGDARFFGSAVHQRLATPITAFAASPDGGGYFLVTAGGQMYHFGDAAFEGSLAHNPPKAPVQVVAMVTTTVTSSAPPPPTTTTTSTPTTTTLPAPPPLTGDPFSHGSIGYDISDFQCAKRGSTRAQAVLPRTTGLAVIQVAGWLDDAANSCLASEVSWAERVGPRGDPYDLYLFMNSPDAGTGATEQSADGPDGRCASLPARSQAGCRAYNYGYNGAAAAFSYAESEQARSSLWWLDIEGSVLAPGNFSNFAAGQYWSSSQTLNDDTIQGALDALHRDRVTVGIYSTSIQYPRIAGSFVPKGPRLPLWIAGAPWTSPPYSQKGLPGPAVLAAWCAGTARYTSQKSGNDLFAGGVPWLLQETPGFVPSPYGIDPDYAC